MNRPTLNRTAPRPICGSTPIACKTGESVTWPSWHAEPVEAAISGMAAKISLPTWPTKLTLSVFGQPLAEVAIEDDSVAERLVQSLPQSIPQRTQVFGRGRQTASGDFARRAETDDVRHILRAGPLARFLAGAMNQRFERDATANEQHADALRGVQLVPGDREQIDAEISNIDGDFAERLGGIGVHEDAVLPADGGDLPNRLERADLVVRVHHGDESRARHDRSANGVRIDAAKAIDRQNCDLCAEPAKEFERLKRGGMLDGGGDEVLPGTPPPAKATPLIARLLASLPPPVKTISSGDAPINAATCARAFSTAAWAIRPYSCELDGLPNASSRNGSMASRTAGSIGVVAL